MTDLGPSKKSRDLCEVHNKINELKHELLESDDDDNANDEKENSYHENDSSSDLDTINTCKVCLALIIRLNQ